MSLPACATRWPPDPLPGDFAVVPTLRPSGVAVSAAEDLAAAVAQRDLAGLGRDWRRWDHAFVYVGGNKVVEAAPGGARVRDLGPAGPESYGVFARWSSGTVALDAGQRGAVCEAAHSLAGTPYSWLDYAAIAAHDLRLPLPWLRARVASSGHLICSQLVDLCYARAGVRLFSDGRWPGYVTPADLALALWDWKG